MIKPTDTVTLPVGLEIDGIRYKSVTIAEMNGYDEENLASRRVRNNGAKAQTLLLRRCIQEIEGLMPRKNNPNELIKEEYVLRMTSYDRDFLFYSIRTLGGVPDIDFEWSCDVCGDHNADTISFEDLEVYEWEDDAPLTISFEMINGVFEDDKMHTSGEWSFLTGKQQERIATVPNERLLSASMAMCISKIGEITHVTEEQMKRLSTNERNNVLEQVASEAPGVQNTLDLCCSSCGAETQQALDVTRFFKSAASPKKKPTPDGKRTRRRLRKG